MSWSISVIGTPENVIKYIEKESGRLTGDSKEEFDAAKPNIISLINMNYNTSYPQMAIEVTANGHRYTSDYQKYGTCSISIKQAGSVLV